MLEDWCPHARPTGIANRSLIAPSSRGYHPSNSVENSRSSASTYHANQEPCALKAGEGCCFRLACGVVMHVANSPRSKHDATPGETPRVSALGIGSGGVRSWLLAVQAVCGCQRRPKRRRCTALALVSFKLSGGQVVSSVWPGLACVLVGLRALAVARVVDEHDETERNRAWAAQSGAPGAGHGSGRGRTIAS